MEGHQAVKDEEKGSWAIISPSGPPVPVIVGSSLTCQSVIENKGVAMASNGASSALSSPAEASTAKPAISSPATFEGIEISPANSGMASASDSLRINGTIRTRAWPPCTAFGDLRDEKNLPSVLTFKGVSVTLENHSVWKQFYNYGTEMILTKQGRRMFPYCRYRLKGLDPSQKYILVLSIVPSNQFKYRWNSTTWEVIGRAENQSQGLVRAFSHHNSPSLGVDWMNGLVSFYRLKITNTLHGWEDGHMVLHSMHRYVPRLNIIPIPDGQLATPDQPFFKGPESMTFTFPQTEFMAVTTYQNFRITQLKITYNPFAKGFREDSSNCRLNKLDTDARCAVSKDPEKKPAERVDVKEEAIDLSMKRQSVPAPPVNEQETRLMLKPIMSKTSKDDPQAIKIIRHNAGKHAIGELVLIQRPPTVEPKEEKHPVSVTQTLQRHTEEAPKAIPVTPVSSRSTLASPQGYAKRKKRINRRWAKSVVKAAAASPPVLRSPSLSVSMQPEVDEVEGLQFVSFISKEALEIHAGDKPADGSPLVSPVAKSTPMRCERTAEEPSAESFDETITCLEAMLLQDLKVLKHRQVIHTALQEVGLKLSSLDQSKSIDLQYLGVRLPLDANPEEDCDVSALSRRDEGLPFISRTGKTSDVTKIKGWKSKFISSKETSKSDGPQKDLSAFCSNMLDEYLESEAQQISERAAAFSTSPEGGVAYQLPAKSSSYVKTLDSVLKRNAAAAKSQTRANRPCPLSHKPLLYSALVSPAPPLSSPTARVKAEAEPAQGLSSGPNAAFTPTSPVSPRPFTHHQSPVASKPAVLTKVQLKVLEMEKEAVNQGQSRTHLTADRLSVALSVLLTAKTQFNQYLSAPLPPRLSSEGPPCGQEFCRLGCVCSSIQRPVRGTLHCQQPGCMSDCTCLKRNIIKYLTMGESQNQNQNQPNPSIPNVEHMLKPFLGVAKLWNSSADGPDTEPLFTPKSAAIPASSKVQNHNHRPRPKQPVREEDKDPVYKYFESMMTCARVRPFNGKTPAKVTAEPRGPVTSTPIIPKEPETTTAKNLTKNYHRTILAIKPSGKSSPGAQTSETEAKKQIEIQSACQWDKDHKVVLEALCLRMNQNRLSQRFFVGPYHIRPVSKIHMRKPSGSVITYRVHISKPMRDSDGDEGGDDDEEDDEDESDVSDEGNISDASGDVDAEEEKEFSPAEEPEMKFGVTPFMSGVLPAGLLKATKKTIGCEASGFVQVNGKSYKQAKLLLGNIGSLHPANRLAAYLTGRLCVPDKLKPKAEHKLDAPDALDVKMAGSVVPSTITAQKTPELKTPTPTPAAPQCHPPPTNPSTPFASNRSNFLYSFQNSLPSSRVSLTVSPSLKTPGFLAERGTYSFRICPPSGPSTKGQSLPGVTLPGGFTLIDLPKPRADTPPELTGSIANVATNAAPTQEDDLFRSDRSPANSGVAGLNLDADHAHAGVTDRSSVGSAEHASSAELAYDESDDAQRRLGESNASESADTSDYGEDEEDEPVDVETVDKMKQNLVIAKMREAVLGDVQQELSSNFSLDLASAERLMNQNGGEVWKGSRRPLNHRVGERFRRFQQRFLFNKLKALLKCDARASKVTLLTLAICEIQNLVKASECLEQKKKTLIEMQSGYLRRISILSGKSGELIKNKLIEICKKQKLREQSMAAATQHKPAHPQVNKADGQQPKPRPKSQTPPSEDVTKAELTACQTTGQKPGPGVSHPAPQLKEEAQREMLAAFTQEAVMALSGEDTRATPVRPRHSPQALTYPLVRSKTGRIILPSSLKSSMHGLYKLMLMKRKKSESSSPQSQERSGVPEPPDSNIGSDRPEDCTATPPEDCTAPPPMIAHLNKPISPLSMVAQQANQEGGAVSGVDTTAATQCCSAAHRVRGRPRKQGEATETEAEGTLGNVNVDNSPTPAKRARGRPPKKQQEDAGWHEAGARPKRKTPPAQTGSRPQVVSPVRWPRGLRSPKSESWDAAAGANLQPGGAATASRPLTRGALGKDFPSAKKRSWIDVEKELEQEIE